LLDQEIERRPTRSGVGSEETRRLGQRQSQARHFAVLGHHQYLQGDVRRLG
jgi:hypothetical protein